MWVLELNDTEISLAEDLNVVYQQPGVAVILEDHVSFGDAALEQSRLHPRQAQNPALAAVKRGSSFDQTSLDQELRRPRIPTPL